MKNKVRIGKDFTIRWAVVTSEGEPYAINADAAILRIYSPYGAKEAIGFIVSGNVIEWVFKGKDQKHLGDYTIELVENNGRDGMVSVDSEDAFTLVAHTNEESLNDEGAVEIQTIELTSQIALAPMTTGGGGGGSYDDTKIKQELAELSSKIDEVAADSSVFEAIYGETTYEEIKEARNKGKYVVCVYRDVHYHLSSFSAISAFFSTIDGVNSKRVWCNANNNWFYVTYELEPLSNKVKSLSSSSTDTQYPSAKAVYDFVNTTLGTIINGEY